MSLQLCPFRNVLSVVSFQNLSYMQVLRVCHTSLLVGLLHVHRFPWFKMAAVVNVPVNVVRIASRRGGSIYIIHGKRYYCHRGKVQDPIEGNLEQEELELLDPALLGRPRYTPLYLHCRYCSARGRLKELEDGSNVDFELQSGNIQFTISMENIMISYRTYLWVGCCNC